MDTTELQNQAIEIRDAENEGENTATKVGTLLLDIIRALAGTVTEESLAETLEAVEEALKRDYASLENGTVKWHQRGVIVLKSMGSALDNIDGGSYTPTFEIGDTWFSQTSGGLKHRTQDGDEAWSVRPDAVYINSHTLRVYKWASGSMVELGSERNPIMIDYMVSKTLDSIAVGEVFWQSSNNKLVVKTGESSVRMFSPDPSVIYCARDTKSLMFWDTTTSTWQSVGGGSSSGLTKVISNIELVNSKVNTLINALANIAFKQLPKPEMTELDWGGAKHTVTINNTLSGCSADKSGTQQVSEGSALVVTITADSGKLLRSVSASSGTVVIAANKTTATVTLTVNDDVTLTIQASATNAATFAASISDNRVSGTGATSGITEGSAWTSVLSLNNTADPSDDITNVTVAMAGGGSDSISAEKVNGEWTVQTGYVTGNITITVTVTGVVKRTITLPTNEHVVVKSSDNSTVLKASDNTSPTNLQVTDGGTFECYITEEEVSQEWLSYSNPPQNGKYQSYELSNVKVMCGQNDITDSVLNRTTGKITIGQVTDNIVITTDLVTFYEGLTINGSGVYASQDLGAFNNNDIIDCCCTKDYLPIPTGLTKVVASAMANSTFPPYVAFYKEENGGYTFLSATQMNKARKLDNPAFISVNLPLTVNSEQVYPTHFRITYKTDIDTVNTTTVNNGGSDVTVGTRINSIRKRKYVLGLDSNGDIAAYLYKGMYVDGRYEDYGIEWDSGLGTDGNNITYENYVLPVCITKFIECDKAEIECVLGRTIKYNGTTQKSNIRFYGSDESYLSNSVTTDAHNATTLTEKTVSVPQNTAYFKLTTANPDDAYVKYTDNNNQDVYLYKGINVTDNSQNS